MDKASSSAVSKSAPHVAIIGAGLGGLGLAALLAKAGFRVTVLERHETLGGRARAFRQDGFTFDMGPSWYLMPDVFEHFFGLLGESVGDHLDLVKLEPSYRVISDGRTLDLHSHPDKAAELFESIEPGAGAMLGKYLKASAYQYEVVMRHFMHANIDSPLDFLSWRMLLAGTKLSAFSTMSAHVRRYFRSPLLQKIMQYQLLFLGSSPFTTPSIYNVMGHVDFNLGVYYPMGGIHRLVEALARIAQKHGAVLKPGAPVERIETNGKRAARLRLASGETVEADIFVSNADVHHTETRLLPPEARAYPPTYWERRQLAPSALIVYLGLKGGADRLLHHNLFFNPEWETSFAELFDGREWPRHPSYYVCRPSHTDRDVAPDGHETLFALMPISARLGYEADMVRRKADALLGAIEADFGVSDIAARTVLRRDYSGEDFARDYSSLGGSALGLAHTLRQTALFRPANRSRKIENLFYVGAGTNPGIGMPICLISAQLAYKRIAGVRTKAPLASLAPLRGSGRTR